MSEMERLEARVREFASAPGDALDWDDVLRRAGNMAEPGLRRRTSWRVSRRMLVMAAAALLLLVAGSAIAALSVREDGAPVQFAPTTGRRRRSAMTRLRSSPQSRDACPDVRSIRLSHDAIPNESGKGTTDYLIAHVDIAAAADNGPSYARASWESDLVIGALFTGFTQAGLAPPFSDELASCPTRRNSEGRRRRPRQGRSRPGLRPGLSRDRASDSAERRRPKGSPTYASTPSRS